MPPASAPIGYLIASEGSGERPALADNFALPPNDLPLPDLSGDPRTVMLALQGGIRGGLASAIFNGAERDLRTLLENGKGWAINGVAGPAPQPAFTASLGETIRLQVTNATAFSQPLHIHGHVWQVLGTVDPAPLSDSAVIPPGETLSLAFRASKPGLWALHSLVAERADGGLITSFLVE